MKTYLYITLISLFYSITSCAQNKFTEGVITVNNEKFDVKKSTINLDNIRPIFVHSLKNKYTGPIPPPKDNYQFRVLKSDIHVDTDLVMKIVYEELNDKKPALHNKGESIGIHFIFETDGKLTDASYSLMEGSAITPSEIVKIDTELRKQIKASFTGIDYKYYTAVDYFLPRIKF
jgi:hypothetical protein